MKLKLIETEAEYIAKHRANPRKYWRGPSGWLESMARGEQDHHIKASYLKKIKKLVKMGIPIPDRILDQAPEYRKAQTDYERYLKARHTSHANVSIAVEDLRESVGYKLKRQDGKVLTDEHKQDVERGVAEMEKVLPGIRKAMQRGDITIAHTNGLHPFLSQAGVPMFPPSAASPWGSKSTACQSGRLLMNSLIGWTTKDTVARRGGSQSMVWGGRVSTCRLAASPN